MHMSIKVIWKPYWYELDQPLIVGEKLKYYLTKDKLCLANGGATDQDIEIEAEITNIYHSELGELLKVDTKGLTYTFYLLDGTHIVIDAEENPGDPEYDNYKVSNWDLSVTLKDVVETGLSSKQRLILEGKWPLKS